MPVTLAELAQRFGCELHGDPHRAVVRVGSLHAAGPDAVTFLANPALRSRLSATAAAAVILAPRFRDDCPVDCLLTENPYAVYARIAGLLHPPSAPVAGVHPQAAVAADAVIAASAQVDAHAVIAAGAEVGENVIIGPGCVVGAGARIGAGSRLVARVTVMDRVVLGERCLLHPGAVIGADGFGFAPDGGEWVKVPQLGSVVMGSDVEIGANTTIDRGALGDTVIEDGVKLDNLVQIAHNVHVGAHTVMAATAGVAGSTRIGRRCMFAGGAAAIGHLNICDDVIVTVRALITRSIDTPGTYSGILPAEAAPLWRRNAVRFRQLDALVDRVRALEKALETAPGTTADTPGQRGKKNG
jgi:UDP-3-O-[3-hydroxymyristoyl] glucosamine N-acyltransferase